MTNKKLSDFKTIIILLVIFVLSSVAILVILRIDLFVHYDLYEFGLEFNTHWANEYWYNKNMLLVFLSGASALSVLSMIPHFDYSIRPTRSSKWSGLLLPIGTIIYLIFSLLLFTQLDSIIQNVLPQYNLIISYIWTTNYWTMNTIALTLIIVSLVLLIIPTFRTLELIEFEIE